MMKVAAFVLVGGLVGALLGYFGKCASGTCPFTANPFRGAGFGALFGFLFAVSAKGNPFHKREAVPESTGIVQVADAAGVKSDSAIRNVNKKERSEDMAVVLKVGDKAPDFSLLDQNGQTVTLSDFAGRKLLVYFYPKADTPGCTKQSCAVSESLTVLREAGLEAVGISPDSPVRQKKFDEKYGLGFPLLADEEKTVAEAYGVWGEKSMYGKRFLGIVRSAFVVGEDGKLLAVGYKISPADTVPFARKVATGQ